MNMNIFNARQYQPVSQKVESDSEDDEVTLYTSPRNNKDGHFGLGSYDQSEDLDLPPVFKTKRKSATTMSRCQTICTISVFSIVLAMVVAVAITMIVFRQMASHSNRNTISCTPIPTPLFSDTSSQPIDTSCTPIPTPLFTITSTTEPHSDSTTKFMVVSEPSSTITDSGESRQSTTLEEEEEHSTQITTSEPTPGANFESTTSIPPTTSTTQTIEPTLASKDSSPQSTGLESTETIEGDTITPTLNVNPSPNMSDIPKVNSEIPMKTDVASTGPSTPGSSFSPPTLSTLPSSRTQFYWEREFFPATTESSIQISDMNRDGVPDVITAQAYSQCGVKVIAMDGNSGDTIWEEEVKFEAFAIRCELDVNRDGVDDCILTGRFGGFAALDGANGSILWEVDKSIVYPRYNFYFPLIVKDMDADGVEELINIHGGDQMYNAEETNRSPASLVVVSGATGQSLMDPIQLPDGHESYMSPVLFQMNGKFDLVLFGTGGETIPGSLWAISMSTIRKRIVRKTAYRKLNQDTYYPFKDDTYHSCYLESDSLDAMRPKFDDTVVDFTRPYVTSKLEAFCPKWSNIVPIWNKYNVCLYKLMNSTTKGIMLPPVIVDLNKDGVKDLVVSTFDGRTIALDGTDLVTQLWGVYYPKTETYSIPAPIFYTDDSVPDVLIRTSLGEWSTYNSSTIRLLNGSDGVELWNFSSAHTSMMSPLIITSYSPGLDAMLFITVGSISSRSAGDMSDSNSNNSFANTTSDSNSTSNSNESVLTGEHRARVDRHSDNSDLKSNGHDGDTHTDGDSYDEKSYDKMFDEFNGLGEAGEVGEDEEDPMNSHNRMDYEDDFIQHAMDMQDPPELWTSTPEDPFPDPDTDAAGFLEYCGESVDRLTGYIWFVTKEMIERGVELKPLAKHDPYILVLSNSSQSSKDHLIFKRHGDGPDPSKASPKIMRCGHIAAPIMSFTTPALGDFNQDGRLDVAYSIVWGPLGGMMMVPPKFKVFVFTLEERFKEVYGSDVVVDFNGFLPSNEQPWSRYMGTTGDNVYRSNN